MKAVAIAALVKEPSDQHLWPRILRANRCHHLAAVHEAALAAFAAPRWMAIMRLPINLSLIHIYSLSDLIDRRFPISSVLTAANCLGIIRREKRAGRALDPVFEESLSQTLRFWFNVAEVLGTPKQRACLLYTSRCV